MEQQTGSHWEKSTRYPHVASITYMQSTSCQMSFQLERQAGIKIAGRNINSIRYADDTTLMEDNEKELRVS